MENKFINRYKSLCSSIQNLKKSTTADPDADFVLEGTVQNFNLTFDLSWKVMKDILVKQLGITDYPTGSPKENLQMAFTNKLIEDDIWLRMLRDRNRLAHDYDGSYASQIFTDITTKYYFVFVKFVDNASKYYTDDSLTETDRFK